MRIRIVAVTLMFFGDRNGARIFLLYADLLVFPERNNTRQSFVRGALGLRFSVVWKLRKANGKSMETDACGHGLRTVFL